MYFFTGDEHYWHKNIITYCNRPFSSVEEMNEQLIMNSNSVVKEGDIVIHTGDFALCSEEEAGKIIKRLNGRHVFLNGDHDRWMGKKRLWDVRYYKIENESIIVCHYCMRTWFKSHYNSWHLYAHCLDMGTEILTKNGWKFREDLSITDEVMTLNTSTRLLEYNQIDEIVDYPHYFGNMYSLQSKGIDLRVTENHVMLDIRREESNKSIRKFCANALKNLERRMFIKAGILPSSGVDISPDHIRLLVWIAADGSLANSNLARVRVLKPRKIERIKWLLNQLKIPYTENVQKDGTTCYNFHIPRFLSMYKLKPLTNIVTGFDRQQIQIMLSEYTHTDGCKNGKSILIYTSKKEEADIIQIASITNGFTCNISTRTGCGFSKIPRYELVITDSMQRVHTNLKEKVVVSPAFDEAVWCVKVKNNTIMVRKNGKPIVVGNSHGTLPSIGKSHDIGVDNNGFFPVSFSKIVELMKSKPNNPNYLGDRH